MGSKTMWLAVEVGEGMFPSERAVRMRTIESDVSLFVAESQVKPAKTGPARMRVELLDSNEKFGLVEIHGQQGPMVVKVQRNDLTDPA